MRTFIVKETITAEKGRAKVAAQLAASDVGMHSSNFRLFCLPGSMVMDQLYLGVYTATVAAGFIEFLDDDFHRLLFRLEALLHQSNAVRRT